MWQPPKTEESYGMSAIRLLETFDEWQTYLQQNEAKRAVHQQQPKEQDKQKLDSDHT